jgi:peptidyl-prolyl cis-trans isomerase D
MFDLFRSRQKAVRYMLIGLLSVVALSMITYLIPGFGSPTTKATGDEATVAEIGNTKISAQEVVTAMARVMSRGQLPPSMVDVYVPQVVDDMVQQKAIEYEFGRLGLTISDEEVLVGLESENGQYFKDGQLIAKDELEQRLAQQGMTLQDLVDQMRRQLMMRKVENMVYASVLVPDKEVQDEYNRTKERVAIKYISFSPTKFHDDVKVTPQDVHAMFEGRHSEFFQPEKRSFQVLIVDQAKLEQSMTVPDSELRAAYAASMDSFRTPERVKARHILIKTEGKSDAEKKQALAKAEDVLKQLKAGADFGQMAQKNSDDTSNAPKGGDLGFFGRGQMVPEFDQAAFNLKPGQLSGIVTTKFGYHILRVDEKESARIKPFEEVKPELAAQIKKERVAEQMQKTADAVHDALVKSPGSADEIAKKFGVEVATVTDATAGSPVPTLGSVPEIDNALAQMKANDVTPVITLPANRLVVAVLKQRTLSRPSTFEEAESKVRERLISLKAIDVAKQKATEAAAKIRAGQDIEKVAKEYKLEVKTPPEFGRADSVEGLGPANSIKDVFNSPVGAVLGPTDVQNNDIVYKKTGVTPADPAGFAAEKAQIRETLRQDKARERLSLFNDSVTAKLTAEKKLKGNHELVSKLAEALKRS